RFRRRHFAAPAAERPARCGPFHFDTAGMDQSLPAPTAPPLPGARRIQRGDADYPLQLAAISGAPSELFVLGDATLLARPQIAIVGSRAPTAAGRRIAASLAADLVTAGYVITSGLARGIDAAA